MQILALTQQKLNIQLKSLSEYSIVCVCVLCVVDARVAGCIRRPFAAYCVFGIWYLRNTFSRRNDITNLLYWLAILRVDHFASIPVLYIYIYISLMLCQLVWPFDSGGACMSGSYAARKCNIFYFYFFPLQSNNTYGMCSGHRLCVRLCGVDTYCLSAVAPQIDGAFQEYYPYLCH